MIAVIFELHPHPEHAARYLELATKLYPNVVALDGFISIERFQSVSDPNKLLSLSFFRDEAAVARWRAFEAHRAAQEIGKRELFSDYRLRVASVLRDYGLRERSGAPR